MKIHIKQYSAAYWRVTIDNPPINLFDPEMADELQAVLTKLESDEAVKVVVFESENSDFFIAPADLDGRTGFEENLQPAVRDSLHNLFKRMNHSHFLTVGLLRGHARGAGSEFLLELDVRFASREKAVLSQIDLGTEFSGIKCGFERLCGQVGRARALEIILGSEDLDADTAQRLGLINRSIPDENLDEFIERFASHVSNLDRKFIALAKQITSEQTNLAMLAGSNETQSNFFETSEWSENKEQIATLTERDLHARDVREIVPGEQLRPDYIL
jgi:enoyl-CoA hydratase/carnithine racemase